MSECLLEKRDDGVALITLNRPESLNALSGVLQDLIGEHLADCATDANVRCIAVTGAGRGFCAGGDVKQQSMRAQERESGQPVAGQVPSLLRPLQDDQMRISHQLHTIGKPTVALVNGPAAGAGMSIALACDMRFCSDQASFHTAFSKVALSGDFGGSYFLQRLIGYGRALELYFTGDRIGADEALALGIANQVVAHDDFLPRGLEYCHRFAQGPTRTYALMKSNFSLAATASLEDALAQEAAAMGESGVTQDHAEGSRAFVERRIPSFSGT